MNAKYKQYDAFLADQVMKPFYLRRLETLKKLRLDDVLRRKNPYLSQSRHPFNCSVIYPKALSMRFFLHMKSTLFGNLLEGFAIQDFNISLDSGFKCMA